MVVSPEGHLLVLTVKAGDLKVDGSLLVKHYAHGSKKVVSDQVQRQHSALLHRLKALSLEKIRIESPLVLPDYHVQSEGLSCARDRIINASQFDQLCYRIRSIFPTSPVSATDRVSLFSIMEPVHFRHLEARFRSLKLTSFGL